MPKTQNSNNVRRVQRKQRRTKLLSGAPAIGAYKLEEARAYLGGISIPTVHRLVARGLLRPNRSTSHLLFTRAELDRFLQDGMTN
jgi:Helix-turn-helix domain